MKCRDCRKRSREMDTKWERLRNWMFNWFKDDIIDLTQDKYTQGFGDGYKVGFEQSREYEENIEKIRKEFYAKKNAEKTKKRKVTSDR